MTDNVGPIPTKVVPQLPVYHFQAVAVFKFPDRMLSVTVAPAQIEVFATTGKVAGRRTPEAIQLDVAPVRAKFKSAPVWLFPLASVKLVTPALLPPAIP